MSSLTSMTAFLSVNKRIQLLLMGNILLGGINIRKDP